MNLNHAFQIGTTQSSPNQKIIQGLQRCTRSFNPVFTKPFNRLIKRRLHNTKQVKPRHDTLSNEAFANIKPKVRLHHG